MCSGGLARATDPTVSFFAGNRPWAIAGLCLLALVVGFGSSIIQLGFNAFAAATGFGESLDVPQTHDELFLWFVVEVGSGLMSVALLPLALRRAPEDQPVPPGRDPAVQHFKEPRSALVVALILGVASTLYLITVPAWFIATVSVCSRGIRHWIYAVFAVKIASAVIYVATEWALSSHIVQSLVLDVSLVLLAIALGMLRWGRCRQVRMLRAEAVSARREAQAIAAAEQARVAKTRAEERTRIAREMHDTLSHKLALISTYAGALHYREDLDGRTVRSTAQLVQQTAATASAELRVVLDVLRDDPADTRMEPDLTRMNSLLDEVRNAGVHVESTTNTCELDELPTAVSRMFYRVVQEALTNAVKHAPGAPVHLEWTSGDGWVTLTVTNPLVVPGAAQIPWVSRISGSQMQGGLGLIGLEERVRAFGGRITITPTPSEFRLEVSVPCPT
ncbi:MAG: histidine kinase [Kocuria sp.]|nr:histidine kinase [Kocuria sp.]